MQRASAAAVTVLVLLASLGTVAGPGTASDDLTVVAVEPDRIEVESGETVALDVVLARTGGHEDAGVYRALARLDYPASHLEAVAVEPRDTFDAEPGAVATRTGIDDSAGIAAAEQRLRDPDEGVRGPRPMATVRFRVAEDVAPSTVRVVSVRSAVEFARAPYPTPVRHRNATVEIAGGGRTVTPDPSESFGFDDPDQSPSATPTPTAAETARRSDDGDATGGSAADGSQRPLLAGLLTVLSIAFLRRAGA